MMEEIQQEKERAGQEERLEKKEPKKLFMRWDSTQKRFCICSFVLATLCISCCCCLPLIMDSLWGQGIVDLLFTTFLPAMDDFST